MLLTWRQKQSRLPKRRVLKRLKIFRQWTRSLQKKRRLWQWPYLYILMALFQIVCIRRRRLKINHEVCNDVEGTRFIEQWKGLWSGQFEIRIPASARVYFFSVMLRSSLAPTQPPIRWVPVPLSLGVRRQGQAHTPPLITEVKNEWSYTSTPFCAFVMCKGITLPFTLFWYLL